MKPDLVKVVTVTDVRGALVEAGDLRGEVAFQNDVNAIIAAVDRISDRPQPPPQPTPERTQRVALFNWLVRTFAT